MTGALPALRMPAEWERHDATWIGWPHHEADWPGKLDAVGWVFAEIVRVLHEHERVEIVCNDDDVREEALTAIMSHGVDLDSVRLHVAPTNRIWLRDSGPTGVLDAEGNVVLVRWGFNAWAKYPDFALDREIPCVVQEITGLPMVAAMRADRDGEPLVLEGGGIETDGAGTILVTEEWLLSDVQIRNPGMSRAAYEQSFARYLGCDRTIWLGAGAAGDDTHGHIDDIARFVGRDTVLLAFEEDPADANHAASVDNLRRLELAGKAQPLRVVKIPYPRAVVMNGQRLPASYANFYVANGVVIVPTFNDANDRVALDTVADCFPGRTVVGIHAVDLVWGLGTLHCLTQQQPAAA